MKESLKDPLLESRDDSLWEYRGESLRNCQDETPEESLEVYLRLNLLIVILPDNSFLALRR